MLARARSLKQSGQEKQSARLLPSIVAFEGRRLQSNPTDGGAPYVRYEANQLPGNHIAAARDLMNAKQYYKPD